MVAYEDYTHCGWNLQVLIDNDIKHTMESIKRVAYGIGSIKLKMAHSVGTDHEIVEAYWSKLHRWAFLQEIDLDNLDQESAYVRVALSKGTIVPSSINRGRNIKLAQPQFCMLRLGDIVSHR